MKEGAVPGRLARGRARLVTVRFAILVGAVTSAIVLVMIVAPLAHNIIPLQIVITAPLIAGVYVVTGSMSLAAGATLAFAALAALGNFALVHHENALVLVDLALRTVVFGAVIVWAGREVLREEEVSLDTILGGVSIYLLTGYLFAHVFLWLLVANPGALSVEGRKLVALSQGAHPLQATPTVLYFSFTTLTTLGFGDVTPVSGAARLVAMGEGTIGQLFPAIFIARLVSLFVARRGSRRDGH